MEDRRAYRRLDLRLPIVPEEGSGALSRASGLTTANISAGGMYFRTAPAQAPRPGAEMQFELTVPPGAGYSASAGRINGSGRVVRVESRPDGTEGVAVEFTEPLAMQF